VAAAQIGELKTATVEKGKKSGKTWPVITSADPQQWSAKRLLQSRRAYWAIEGKLHQRLDISLDEDRSRIRTPKGLTVMGRFRRLVVSFACAWLDRPQRRKQKKSTRDFLDHLKERNARRGFALLTSAHPKAWKRG